MAVMKKATKPKPKSDAAVPMSKNFPNFTQAEVNRFKKLSTSGGSYGLKPAEAKRYNQWRSSAMDKAMAKKNASRAKSGNWGRGTI